MGPESQVQDFVDRLEAFLLTHDDDHPIMAGTFGNEKTGGCPIAQITGLYKIERVRQCAFALANGKVSLILTDAIAVFIDTYDEEMGAWKPLTDEIKVMACRLGKARPAIRKAIERVKTKWLNERAPEELAISETQIPVTV